MRITNCLGMFMKKTLITILVGFVSALMPLQGQELNVGLNGGGAQPVSWHGEHTQLGYSGNFALDYVFKKHFSLGIEGGIRKFAFLEESLGTYYLTVQSLQVIPGYTFLLTRKATAYIQLGAGVNITSSDAPDIDPAYQNFDNDLGLSPRLGFTYALSKTLCMDVQVNYYFGSALSYVGVNLGAQYTLWYTKKSRRYSPSGTPKF